MTIHQLRDAACCSGQLLTLRRIVYNGWASVCPIIRLPHSAAVARKLQRERAPKARSLQAAIVSDIANDNPISVLNYFVLITDQ